MGKRRSRFTLAIAVVLALGATSIAYAASHHHANRADHHMGNNNHMGNQGEVFTAQLNGYNEVPANNSPATGELTLTVGNGQLTWSLTYQGFPADQQPMVAHVHVGQPGVSGGVVFYFCGGGGKPACPSSANGPVTITGTTLPADVVGSTGATAQLFNAGDLDSVIRAIEGGVTYANMHTSRLPAGEIRGQLVRGHGDDENHGGGH
jgi:hypothetical protein